MFLLRTQSQITLMQNLLNETGPVAPLSQGKKLALINALSVVLKDIYQVKKVLWMKYSSNFRNFVALYVQ